MPAAPWRAWAWWAAARAAPTGRNWGAIGAQFHADVLGVAIDTLDGGSAGGAWGAASLRALACGRSEADVCGAPAVLHSYLPRAEKAALLQQRLALFAQLYPRLKDLHLPSA